MTPTDPSRRMTVARAYERALFAGDMDAVARCLTDDVVYWVAGLPPIGRRSTASAT